ncbi:hypothetical protein HPT27_17820 [Permianibacter sp. IMCC34836]|uniref:hypothetical protein n=1 Tax=Permianibacter fluminis TaxID=2738515 RepID=UPI0015564A07|nr:hypothetical protein [Permianibacter fluminis]NQD38878.1 hypothetical protein [Permianibacter fluminis]
MQRRMLAVLMAIAGVCSGHDDIGVGVGYAGIGDADVGKDGVGNDAVWGSDWMLGGYHQHDLQLSERVGLALDWQGRNIAGMSLRYSSAFANPVATSGLAGEEPLTFRLTLRGWELFEADADGDTAAFFSFDRIRDREIRQQLVMISISKHF